MAVSKSLRYQILRRDNHTCRYCGRSAPEVKLTVDHVVPETLGGSDHPSNLVTACGECNGGKSATPPDAAMVAQVADDAARWAAAQQVVAEQMLGQRSRHAALGEQFDQAWRKWGNWPRPSTWRRSVDTFIAAGLPMEILIDCVDAAAQSKKVERSDAFRYMCGIAWSRVREMRERVAAEVGIPQEVADDEELTGILEDLIGEFGQADIEARVGEERADGIPDADIPFRIASSLAISRSESFTALVGYVDELIEVIPIELLNETIEEARFHGITTLDEEFRSIVLGEIARWLAQQYLDTLDDDEVAEWAACVRQVVEHPADLPRVIVAAARQYKHNGEIPAYLCQAPGKHGAACPEPMEPIRQVGCDMCRTGSHPGHFRWCAEHLRQAAAGELRRPDGAAYQFVDMPTDETTEPRS